MGSNAARTRAGQVEKAAAQGQKTHWFFRGGSAFALPLVVLAHTFGARAASAAETAPAGGGERSPLAGPATAPAYETTVTAASSAATAQRGREDAAASVSVVTIDRTARSAESLPQLLSELPGTVVTRMGGLGSLATLSLRGSSSNQVLVFVDGVPLNTATAGGVDLALIPIGDLERIEVYRGASPLAFGASAMGGIVSIASLAPRATGAVTQAGGGSFGAAFAGARATWVGERTALLASFNHLGSAGTFLYPNDNGTPFNPDDDRLSERQNNHLSQQDGLLRVTVRAPGRRRLNTSCSFLTRERGVPARAIYQSYKASLRTRRFIAQAGYESRDDLGPGGRLRALAYGSVTQQSFVDDLQEIAFLPTRTHDRTTVAGATLNAERWFAPWIAVATVVDGRREKFEPYDERGHDPGIPASTRAFGAAGVEPRAIWDRARLHGSASLRIEAARDSVLDRDLHKGTYGAVTVPQSYVLPIAHAAVTQSPAPWLTLRTNLGRYARLPTITERYGNTGFILGNPDLTHESGINADAGVTLRRGGAGGDGAADSAVASSAPRITIDGAVFVAHARDLIHFQQTNQGVMRARNVGRARTVGAELATDARWRRFRMTAQATFANARDVGDVSSSRGRLLPHQPRVRVYARPELRGVPLAGSWRAGVHADVDVTGGNHLDPANQIAVARRVVFGAGARIDSTRYGLDLVVSAQNLSNSHINDLAQFPLPGRAVFATLRWSSPALLSPEPTHNETGLTGAQETHP